MFPDLEFVVDVRDDKRYFGPFDKGNGVKYCQQLNEYICLNELGPVLTSIMKEIRGPLYLIKWERIPLHAQKELIRLYHA